MTTKVLALIFFAFILSSCSPRINISKVNQSSVDLKTINFEPKGIYPEPLVSFFVKKIKTPDKINISSGIELFRVSYFTTDEEGKRILVSGLLAIPRNKKIKGVVAYFHGTNNDRLNAPSRPSQDEGIAISAIFTGGGYLCLIPDFIGFGVSNEVHTYLHSKTTVNAVVDLLKIGSEICTVLTRKEINNLFLTGFSQGGHATAAVHRFIEIKPIKGLNLLASSAIAGAYNLKEISVPFAIENNSVYYLAYVANSYCHIYKKPLSSIISDPFDSVVPKIFDGNHSLDEISARLPKYSIELYTKEILNDIKSGQNNWFTEKLGENQTYDWKPRSIFRIYFGACDKDVSPQDAIATYQNMKRLGGNVQLIELGNLNHIQSAYSGLPKTRAFFDSLTFLQQKQIKLP